MRLVTINSNNSRIYRTGTETSTVHSPYRPLYSIVSNTEKIIETGKPVIFGIPIYRTNIRVSTYKEVLDALKGHYWTDTTYIPRNEAYTVGISHGFLEDLDQGILFIFVTGLEFKPESDRMFISPKFFEDKYKNLYRRVFDEIIKPALDCDVPMEVISSEKIMKTIFRPILKQFNEFENLEEYQEFLENELEEELFLEEELLKIVDRDESEIRDLITSRILYETDIFPNDSVLDKLTEEVLKIGNDNIFIPTEKIIGEHLKNIDLFGLLNEKEDVSTNPT